MKRVREKICSLTGNYDAILLTKVVVVFSQLHYLFNVAHYMRLIVQRESGLDLLKVMNYLVPIG